MDEKIIIQEKAEQKTIKKSFMILGILIVLFVVLFFADELIREYKWDLRDKYYPDLSRYELLESIQDIIIRPIGYIDMILAGLCIFYCIAMWLMSKCEIAVTSHRVYGRSWKEQVSLPLDSVSAVKKGMFKSVVVATSSGKVAFSLLKKQNEIFDAVSTLLKERQIKPAETVSEKKPASSVEELKEYKGLLDAGIITQEEFDAKKKQLLGL